MAHSEPKKWQDYSKDDQKLLLFHWWYYYGKSLLTLAEMDEFSKLLDTHTQNIFELAIVDYLTDGEGPIVLLSAMRQNRVEELFKIISDIPKTDAVFAAASISFLKMLLKSYNEPEPNKPFTDEQIGNQLREKQGRDLAKEITPEFITQLATHCADGKDRYIAAHGLSYTYFFCENKIAESKELIAKILIQLGIDTKTPIVFGDLTKLKDGRNWNQLESMADFQSLDQLLALAVACGFIINDENTQKINQIALGDFAHLINPAYYQSLDRSKQFMWLLRICGNVLPTVQFVTQPEEIKKWGSASPIVYIKL